MRIGIIGPSDLKFLEQINDNAKNLIMDIAISLAEKKAEIVVTPDKGSASEFFAQQFLQNGGEKVFEIIPEDDKEFGLSWMNTEIGEKINCGTWRNQPEKFNEECDALICLGYAVGGIIEIMYSKWFKPKPVYIITELISQRLPTELNKSLDLKYISYRDIAKI